MILSGSGEAVLSNNSDLAYLDSHMDKNALIIGGSSGIGLATVKKLIANDFNVIVIHRDRKSTNITFQEVLKSIIKKEGQRLATYNADGTNPDIVKETVNDLLEKGIHKFDLVLHSVARGNLRPLTNAQNALSAKDLELTINAMGTNLLDWVNHLLDSDMLSTNCRIIGVTSEGNDRVWPSYGAVGIAKANLETLAKYLAVELGGKGIRVNIIQAGVIDTPSMRLIPEADLLIEHTLKRNPSKRMTRPEDVANVVYLLTLPESEWINGSLIHVDGGEHLI